MLVIDCCVSVHVYRIVCLLSSSLVDHGIFIMSYAAHRRKPKYFEGHLVACVLFIPCHIRVHIYQIALTVLHCISRNNFDMYMS